jgi:hypothetical protein
MQASNATPLLVARHATPANVTQQTPTQKQHSSMVASKLARQAPPCRALLQQQAGPTTCPCTASSITPCSTSLRPHLHHAIASLPPRRTQLSTTPSPSVPPPLPRTHPRLRLPGRLGAHVASTPPSIHDAIARTARHLAVPPSPAITASFLCHPLATTLVPCRRL